jgi:hypothetical protein
MALGAVLQRDVREIDHVLLHARAVDARVGLLSGCERPERVLVVAEHDAIAIARQTVAVRLLDLRPDFTLLCGDGGDRRDDRYCRNCQPGSHAFHIVLRISERKPDVTSKLTRRHRVGHVAELRAGDVGRGLDGIRVENVQRVRADLDGSGSNADFFPEPQIHLRVRLLRFRVRRFKPESDRRELSERQAAILAGDALLTLAFEILADAATHPAFVIVALEATLAAFLSGDLDAVRGEIRKMRDLRIKFRVAPLRQNGYLQIHRFLRQSALSSRLRCRSLLQRERIACLRLSN